MEQEERGCGGDDDEPDVRRAVEHRRRTLEMHSRDRLKDGQGAARGRPDRVAGRSVEGVIDIRPAGALVTVRRRYRDGHITQMHMQLRRMRVERKSADVPQDREDRDPKTEPRHRRVLAMHIASRMNPILEGARLSNTNGCCVR